MALQKTFVSQGGIEYVDAYHVIRNLKIERNNLDGFFPGAERGYYIVIDVDVYEKGEDREKGSINVETMFSNIQAIMAEHEKNFVFYIEDLNELPGNIVQYAYDLLKTTKIYSGAVDI